METDHIVLEPTGPVTLSRDGHDFVLFKCDDAGSAGGPWRAMFGFHERDRRISFGGGTRGPYFELLPGGVSLAREGFTPHRAAAAFWIAFHGLALEWDGRARETAVMFEGGKVAVRVGSDGAVSFEGGYAPDANARAFWQAVGECHPFR
jgi:hypothetical protein